MAVAVQARLTAGVRVTPLCHADVQSRWPAAADRRAHVGHEVVHVAVCDADSNGSGVRVGVDERRVCAGVIRREAPVCSVATCNV